MPLIEGVEKTSFHLLTRRPSELTLDLRLHSVAKTGKIREPQRHSQGVVDFRGRRRFDLTDRHLEDRRAALQGFDRIGLREGYRNVHLVAGANADELIFEAFDEPPLAKNQRLAFGGAAFKCLPVDPADEIDHNRIALDRGLSFRARIIGFRALGNTTQRLGDLILGRLSDQTLHLEPRHIGRLEVRHDLDGHVKFEIRFAGNH